MGVAAGAAEFSASCSRLPLTSAACLILREAGEGASFLRGIWGLEEAGEAGEAGRGVRACEMLTCEMEQGRCRLGTCSTGPAPGATLRGQVHVTSGMTVEEIASAMHASAMHASAMHAWREIAA